MTSLPTEPQPLPNSTRRLNRSTVQRAPCSVANLFGQLSQNAILEIKMPSTNSVLGLYFGHLKGIFTNHLQNFEGDRSTVRYEKKFLYRDSEISESR